MSGNGSKANTICKLAYKLVDRGGDFQRAESVLVEYKGLYYPAKVQKIGIEEEEFYYFIHYVGWNKTRDEWVWKDRILKRTDENLKMSEELHAKYEESAKLLKNRKPSSGKEKDQKEGNNNCVKKAQSIDIDQEGLVGELEKLRDCRKAGGKIDEIVSSGTERDQSTKELGLDQIEKEEMPKIEHFIRFPDSLAQLLVEDHLEAMGQKLELEIPSAVTVEEILDDYVEHIVEIGGTQMDAIGLAVALKHDFNALLRSQLLYSSELRELEKFECEDRVSEPSSVFGGHHFLRLFTRLGARLKEEFPAEEFQGIVKDLENFLEFLSENFKKYFKPNSVTPPGSPSIGGD